MPNALSRSRAIDRAHSTRPLHCACAVPQCYGPPKSNSYRAKVGPFCCSSPLAFSLHLLRLSLRDRVIVIRCHCKRSRSICSTQTDGRQTRFNFSIDACRLLLASPQPLKLITTTNGNGDNFISQPINNATDRHYWPGGGTPTASRLPRIPTNTTEGSPAPLALTYQIL